MDNHSAYLVYQSPSEKTTSFYKLNPIGSDENATSSELFYLQSFDSKESPKYFNVIELNHWEEIPLKDSKNFKLDKTNSIAKEIYFEIINKAITALKTKKLQKVVISRKIDISFTGDFPYKTFFEKLIENYPQAYKYLFSNENTMWIGASPELFLKKENENISTFSLAGTLPISEIDSLSWSAKEFEEQKIVSDYILNIFEKNHIQDISIEGPHSHIAGNLIHLLSTINGKLNPNSAIQNLIADLHPTPAVLGFPKEETISIINELETHSRDLYTGILGFIGKSDLELFVNLRCLKIENQILSLFVGGGITKDSIPEKEWEETEFKSQTLLRVLKEII